MASIPIAGETGRFVADVGVNMRWQSGGGRTVDVVAEAGQHWQVPADLADRFLRTFGPRPGDASVSNRDIGLIPGLRRV